ncbi:MAG: FAD-dependent oxidoreductase [Raoultibacter sp.]|jgi:fumarate reductase flavoprotein subunit
MDKKDQALFQEPEMGQPGETQVKGGLKRRDFFKLAATAGVASTAAAGMALSGCASAQTSSKQSSSSSDSAAEKFESYAQPIDPVDPPSSWDFEVDAVIVGGGGGGLIAALKLAEAGKEVVLIEKNENTGGICAESTILMNLGGHKHAEAAQWAFPEYPYNPDRIVEYLMDKQGLGGEPSLYRTMAVAGPKCIDWMIDDLGARWIPMTTATPVYTAYLIWEGTISPKNIHRTNTVAMKYFTDLAIEKGVTILTSTEASALIKDGDRIIGLQAKNGDEEIFLKGADGVILTAGGFALNRAMVKKYCPTVFPGVANYYPPPYDTGECVRMGLGVGAAISGKNSAATYDGGIDWGTTGEYDEHFTAHYVQDGATSTVRQPWLTIDALGNRVPFYSSSIYPYSNAADPTRLADGLDETGAVHLTRFGGRSYVVFDSKFEEYTKDNALFKVKLDRALIDIPDDDPFADRIPKEQRDWHNGFNYAVENEAIKKCDTIEELEKALELNEGVLVEAVEKWNAACAAGEDYADNFKLEPEWLKALENPPYYGAKIGGNIYCTKAGLHVNSQMQVINTEGKIIPGLYAGFHTAGGSSGENNISSRTHGGQYGCFGTSLIGGFLAAGGILGEKY